MVGTMKIMMTIGTTKMTKAEVDHLDDLSQKIITLLRANGMNRDADKVEDVLYDVLEHAETKAMED